MRYMLTPRGKEKKSSTLKANSITAHFSSRFWPALASDSFKGRFFFSPPHKHEYDDPKSSVDCGGFSCKIFRLLNLAESPSSSWHWADFPRRMQFLEKWSERCTLLRSRANRESRVVYVSSRWKTTCVCNCARLGISTAQATRTRSLARKHKRSKASPPFCIKSTHNKDIQIIPLKIRNVKTLIYLFSCAPQFLKP